MKADAVVLNGLRVLAVDDNADTRELLTFVLEEYGIEVLTAASATEALEIIAQLKPDSLLIDIAMPGEDGYSLIGKVRNLEAEEGGQIPAIALTASVDENGPALAIKAGFQNFITKPFDEVELVTAIANLAERRLMG